MVKRFVLVLAVLVAVSVPSAGISATSAALPAPLGLRAFLLRADEPVLDTFPRTPSFAWTPYQGTKSYDFELATSMTFDDSSVVWSTSTRSKPLQIPAVAIPVALPWMTGNPYALYAHVRAHTRKGVSEWSKPFGFNMRWKSLPDKIDPDIPGLIRWQPVEGATSYEVWFVDACKLVSTTTNVADEREYYTFHRTALWMSTVTWRVRAVRKTYGTIPNGLPVVTTGPWSEPFISTNPDVSSGALQLAQSVSEKISTSAKPQAHSLTPGFSFSGDGALDGTTARLFRVYIATDRQCVNIVFRGPIVGSPAWAPRTTGTLALPTTTDTVTAAQSAYLADGKETAAYSADFKVVTTDEQNTTDSTGSSPATPTTTGGSGTTPTTTPTTTTAATTIPADFKASGSLVDLWDSGWPTGRYYWTVVPVKEVTSVTAVRYQDAEVLQDACNNGRVSSFGKASQPATTAPSRPYASGLSPTGELVAAKTAVPSFYKAALIAWAPALGATGYEVQWSKTKYPWKAVSTAPFYTSATSVLLEGLAPGHWFYRVRGIDPYVPGPVKEMAWSDPVEIVLAKPTFSVVSSDGDVTVTPVGAVTKPKK